MAKNETSRINGIMRVRAIMILDLANPEITNNTIQNISLEFVIFFLEIYILIYLFSLINYNVYLLIIKRKKKH